MKIMKYLVYLFFGAMIITSCNSGAKGNMIVSGNVDGLKKGTLYLEKIQDTALVTLDSVVVDGTSLFELGADITDAEIFFINLDKNPNYRLSFFGEPGQITINTELEKFDIKTSVMGSKNQEILDNYNRMAKRFNDARLDLIEANFEAQQSQNQKALDSIIKQSEGLIKRRYFYTTNFAVQHAEYEVAPYLAITELYNATNKLLDTINNSLSPKVKESKYGKSLQELIDSRNE